MQVAMIVVRALRADISRYNRDLTEEEKAEEREETVCGLYMEVRVLVSSVLAKIAGVEAGPW
jgi:hypothetical protein